MKNDRIDRRIILLILSKMPFLFLLSSGCIFVKSAERGYLSNQTVLQAVAKAAGYQVDPVLYQLVGVEAREDLITFQYRGLDKIGDIAWVVRFSEKSTEQDPQAVSDVYSLLPLLQEGRTGFSVVEDGERKVVGNVGHFVRYRFDSPVSDNEGKPFPAHGIVLNLERSEGKAAVVYQIKLDNHGDRDDVVWEDLGPFLEPLSGR